MLSKKKIDKLMIRARVFQQKGESRSAEECYNQILQEGYESATVYYNLGCILLERKEYHNAKMLLEKATVLDNHMPNAYFSLGNALRNFGQYKEAALAYKKELQLNPKHKEALFNMARLYQIQGESQRAVKAYQQLVEQEPAWGEAWFFLGQVLEELKHEDAAIEAYMAAKDLGCRYPELSIGLGSLAYRKNDIAQALAYYQQVTAKDQAAYAVAQWNRGIALLAQGEYRLGFQDYEYRFRAHENNSFMKLMASAPVWNGEELLGKRILVVGEQGFGDCIQFSRYICLLKQLGAVVSIYVRKELARLFLSLLGIDEVVVYVDDEELPKSFDWIVPLLSLPRIFDTTLETVPAGTYLLPEKSKVEFCQKQLPPKQVKVGFVWASNPDSVSGKERSCTLKEMAVLFGNQDVLFVSLQKGKSAQDIADFRAGNVIDISPALRDFTDTAAVIANLDLVITVDTAVAHLAGAMGIPVWVLIPWHPDWRWMLSGETSPWYPTMRLFRQRQRDNWLEVINLVDSELRKLV